MVLHNRYLSFTLNLGQKIYAYILKTLKVYPTIKCRHVLTDIIHLIHQDVIRSTVFLRANIFLSVLRLIYYVFYVKNIFSRSMCVNVCKRQMFHTSCVLCSASSKVLLKLFCLIYIQSATYY